MGLEVGAGQDGDRSAAILLLVELLKFASLINRPMLDGVASPEGLSLNELRVLMSLGGEGEAAGHALAELMGMPPMNVSRAFAALHERGWIEQGRDAANRRRKPFRLSEAGWTAYRAMTPEVEAVAGFVLGTLSAAERRSLARIVDKLVRQTAKWRPAEA